MTKVWNREEKQVFWKEILKYLDKIKTEYTSSGLEVIIEQDYLHACTPFIKVYFKVCDNEKVITIQSKYCSEILNPSAYFAIDRYKRYKSVNGTKLGIKAVVREFMFNSLNQIPINKNHNIT